MSNPFRATAKAVGVSIILALLVAWVLNEIVAVPYTSPFGAWFGAFEAVLLLSVVGVGTILSMVYTILQ